jgi:hypothetical protein
MPSRDHLDDGLQGLVVSHRESKLCQDEISSVYLLAMPRQETVPVLSDLLRTNQDITAARFSWEWSIGRLDQ